MYRRMRSVKIQHTDGSYNRVTLYDVKEPHGFLVAIRRYDSEHSELSAFTDDIDFKNYSRSLSRYYKELGMACEFHSTIIFLGN